MPVVGIGTYSLHDDVCVNAIKSAISQGFRKIDTDYMYGNEEEVGQAVRESGIPRDSIFVATKLYPNQYSNPEAAIEQALQKLDIAIEAWYPLGGRGYNSELLSDPTLAAIAENYGKSLVQVIFRWDLQRGVVVVPGSSNPDHILENISIFDFELSDEEMEQISNLDRNEKHDWY